LISSSSGSPKMSNFPPGEGQGGGGVQAPTSHGSPGGEVVSLDSKPVPKVDPPKQGQVKQPQKYNNELEKWKDDLNTEEEFLQENFKKMKKREDRADSWNLEIEKFEKNFMEKQKLHESQLLKDQQMDTGFVSQLERQKAEMMAWGTKFLKEMTKVGKLHTCGEDPKMAKKFEQLRYKIERSPARSSRVTTMNQESYLPYDIKRHKEIIHSLYSRYPIEPPTLPNNSGNYSEVFSPTPKEKPQLSLLSRNSSVLKGFGKNHSSSSDTDEYESFSEELLSSSGEEK